MSFLKLGLVLLVSLGVVSFSVLDRASEGIRGPDAEASHADSMAIGNQDKKPLNRWLVRGFLSWSPE